MSSLQWEEYLESYYEQKRLEKYQQNRSLPRPETTKLTIALYVILLLLIITIFATVQYICATYEVWVRIIISVVFVICLAESYGRLLAIKIVECYQHYAKEETRRKCKCVPSCSEYAVLCLKKYELIYALIKIRKRLFVTCRGFDYIVDNP